MYTPSFPFTGNQLILASDRVHLLARTDAVILMGDQSVILSSPNEVHIDSNKAVLIDSPKVELGNEAELMGQPVILGRDFIKQLQLFLQQVSYCGATLESVGKSNLADMASKIVDVGSNLKNSSDKLKNHIQLDDNQKSKVLSNVTYTR
jgi:hypothetical protein